MTSSVGTTLDDLMADAWRPVVTERLGGWRYRWADGVSRRANSALAIGGDEDLERLVETAEVFYAEREAPTRILVSSASAPEMLVPYLVGRGYESSAPTLVARALTADVLDRSHSASCDVSMRRDMSDEWFDAYWSVEATHRPQGVDTRVYRESLLRAGLPAVFAVARVDGEVVGTGHVVIDRGWAGVQCMTTAAGHRGRGIGRAVLHALATESSDRGIDAMYLAVMTDNAPARQLYRSVGFETSHDYRFFTRHS